MAPNKPLVSVIIPCYNHGCFVDDAVNSVLAQTYRNFEIIIVNDGSTEVATNKKLKNYNKPKTKVLHTKNQGLSAARNSGIRIAKGKYILPLDADDKLHPKFLAKTVRILNNHPTVGFVYSYVQHFGENDGVWMTSDYDFKRILVQNHVCVCSLIRKKSLDQVGGYNVNMNPSFEDWDLWISLGEAGWEGKLIKEFLFYYRWRKDSLSKTILEKREIRRKLITQLCLNHAESYKKHLPYVIREKDTLYKEQLDTVQWYNQNKIVRLITFIRDNNLTANKVLRFLIAPNRWIYHIKRFTKFMFR